jgi:chorismate synthase
MSSFGRIFRITTFGESHCTAVGVTIENCPPKMVINNEDIQTQLNRRRPGQSNISTPRNEEDKVEIISGMENNLTLGTMLTAIVKNKNTKPEDYKWNKDYVPRPSHADYTYISKYGIHACSGGGRSSARETIGRVIAGSIAEKWLKDNYNIEIVAWVDSVGEIKTQYFDHNISREDVDQNIIRCPDPIKAKNMIEYITKLKKEGNSTGGTIRCICRNVPIGLGEPVFDKMEALLAHAMLSIPATKGFEIGSGFSGSKMTGLEHNDPFILKDEKIRTLTNNSGGIQGGISNGENIEFKVAFKPPATISLKQSSVTLNKEEVILEAKGRHDPCVVNRAIPIVESMAALVIIDLLMLQKIKQ